MIITNHTLRGATRGSNLVVSNPIIVKYFIYVIYYSYLLLLFTSRLVMCVEIT